MILSELNEMEILSEVQRTGKNFFMKDVMVGIWSLYHTYNAMFEERNLKKDHTLGFSSYSWWSVVVSDEQFSNQEETLGFDIRGENASDQGTTGITTRINGFKWLSFSVSFLTPIQFEQMRRKRAHAINIVIKQVPLIHLYMLHSGIYQGLPIYN